MNNLMLFLQVYLRPGAAVSDIMDRGSWAFAVVLMFVVSAGFFYSVNAKLDNAYRLPAMSDFYPAGSNADSLTSIQLDEARVQFEAAMASHTRVPVVGESFFNFASFDPSGFFIPLLTISVFYIPLLVYLISVFGDLNEYGDTLRREYGTLATCSLMAWAAAHLPFAIAGIAMYSLPVDPEIYLAMWAASALLFGILMVFVLRTVLGLSFRMSASLVCVGWLAFSLANFIFQYVSPLFFLPPVVFYAFIYFSSFFGGKNRKYRNTVRSEQRFRQLLDQILINRNDAGAHIELALVYRRRHQPKKAIAHFSKALEIDPNEIDANYEFGKMARRNGDLQKALDHFGRVIQEDDSHSLNEIWREIGATYLTAKMFGEARQALETFISRRPFDAEGLYYLGKALKAEGGAEVARQAFEQAVESVRVSPSSRRRYIRIWAELAEKEI